MKERRAAYAPVVHSAGAARRFVRQTLEAFDLTCASDVACLLTSELVTNAVVHAGSAVDVVVAVSDGQVRVEVHDRLDEPLPPARSPASVEATAGRGLLLVDTLSDSWGVDHDDTGKTVWFAVAP